VVHRQNGGVGVIDIKTQNGGVGVIDIKTRPPRSCYFGPKVCFEWPNLLLTSMAPMRPDWACANPDHDRLSVSYSDQRPGFGCDANAASIMRPWLARSLSFGGGRMLQAISCALPHDVPTAAAKAQPSSVQAGPAITSVSSRSQPHRGGKRRAAVVGSALSGAAALVSAVMAASAAGSPLHLSFGLRQRVARAG
jgi:hypothetical protein